MEEYQKDEFCKCAVSAILKYHELFSAEIFVKLSATKILRLTNEEDKFFDILEKYKSKGLNDIYIKRLDYDRFVKQVKLNFSSKLKGEKDSSKAIGILKDSYLIAKESAKKMGLDETSIGLIDGIAKGTSGILKHTKGLSAFLKDFEKNCEAEFSKTLLTGHVSSSLVTNFSWQSKSIKEKVVFANLVKDILLGPEDFEEMIKLNNDYNKLSDKIRNHPADIARMLKRYPNQVSNDVITMVEQHHERPDGSGYPLKLTYQRFSFLSAINIVAEGVVDIYHQHDFDIASREVLKQVSDKFGQGKFKEAIKSYATCIGVEDPAEKSSKVEDLTRLSKRY